MCIDNDPQKGTKRWKLVGVVQANSQPPEYRTCPARVPSSHQMGLSETLGETPRNPYLVGGFNPSEKY